MAKILLVLPWRPAVGMIFGVAVAARPALPPGRDRWFPPVAGPEGI